VHTTFNPHAKYGIATVQPLAASIITLGAVTGAERRRHGDLVVVGGIGIVRADLSIEPPAGLGGFGGCGRGPNGGPSGDAAGTNAEPSNVTRLPGLV
jgi:hypothetical protein